MGRGGARGATRACMSSCVSQAHGPAPPQVDGEPNRLLSHELQLAVDNLQAPAPRTRCGRPPCRHLLMVLFTTTLLAAWCIRGRTRCGWRTGGRASGRAGGRSLLGAPALPSNAGKCASACARRVCRTARTAPDPHHDPLSAVRASPRARPGALTLRQEGTDWQLAVCITCFFTERKMPYASHNV